MAGDVPIFELFEVVDQDGFFVGGVEFDLVFFEGGDGGGGEGGGVDEPLFFEDGFEDGAAFVAVGDRVGDGALVAEEALVFEVR